MSVCRTPDFSPTMAVSCPEEAAHCRRLIAKAHSHELQRQLFIARWHVSKPLIARLVSEPITSPAPRSSVGQDESPVDPRPPVSSLSDELSRLDEERVRELSVAFVGHSPSTLDLDPQTTRTLARSWNYYGRELLHHEQRP